MFLTPNSVAAARKISRKSEFVGCSSGSTQASSSLVNSN